jgi:hypothetical protein
MVEVTEEYITKSENDLNQILSIESTLSEYAASLYEIEGARNKLKNEVQTRKRSPPSPPDMINLGNPYGWKEYLAKCRDWIQKNKEVDKMNEELKGLDAKYDDISSQIIKSLPSEYHNIRMMFKNQKAIYINDGMVTVIE